MYLHLLERLMYLSRKTGKWNEFDTLRKLRRKNYVLFDIWRKRAKKLESRFCFFSFLFLFLFLLILFFYTNFVPHCDIYAVLLIMVFSLQDGAIGLNTARSPWPSIGTSCVLLGKATVYLITQEVNSVLDNLAQKGSVLSFPLILFGVVIALRCWKYLSMCCIVQFFCLRSKENAFRTVKFSGLKC